MKKEPSDAEFVKTLNASFEKERGHKIQIRRDSGVIRTELSFSELAAKMSKAKGSVVRGKVASSGLKSGGFGVPKILGRRETNTENKFLKPNLKEHLESMDNQVNSAILSTNNDGTSRMTCCTSRRSRKKWRNRVKWSRNRFYQQRHYRLVIEQVYSY